MLSPELQAVEHQLGEEVALDHEATEFDVIGGGRFGRDDLLQRLALLLLLGHFVADVDQHVAPADQVGAGAGVAVTRHDHRVVGGGRDGLVGPFDRLVDAAAMLVVDERVRRRISGFCCP